MLNDMDRARDRVLAQLSTLDDMMDMVARRWVLMLAVMIFGLALSIGFGMGQRPVYHAREVLQIVPPKVAQELAATTVGEPLVRHVPQLAREVQSETSLAEIINAYGLFAGDDETSMSALTERLRERVDIRLTAASGASAVVVVEARMDHPELARLMAQEFSHRLIGQSVAMRIGEARATLHFLTQAETALRAELAAMEAQWAGTAKVSRAETREMEREQQRLRQEISLAAQRRGQAQIGVDLEVQRQSERLVVLEPAQRPERPVTDIRGLSIAIGGAISTILAFAVALIAEGRHPVLRSAGQMYRLTGISPIITVPCVALAANVHGAAAAGGTPGSAEAEG